ncbi:protein phosphatase 2C domain-containing protein [Streptomyces avicenniae]|uniref:protein phosphatase 2C domain-containing protein n=1 Tax=Streptomyces avicenniae TaxID=500153 RepID=UPI00069B2072|nr:protein phosphatase 2C domain-containing protein [Streptomyces avicenniae]
MPQLDQLSTCPGCGEPLEDDDRFCGVCGTDVTTVARAARPPQAGGTEADFRLPPPRETVAARVEAQIEPGPEPGAPSGQRQAADPRAVGRPDPRSPAPPVPPAAPAPAAPAPAPAQPPAPVAAQEPAAPAADAHGAPPSAPADPRRAHQHQAARAPREDPRRVCAVCGNGFVDQDGFCTECGRSQPGDRDHVESALGGVAAVSDLGHRHHRNEDAFTVSTTALPDGSPAVLAVVCDGVSSSTRPDDASATAARAALRALLTLLPQGVPGPRAMNDALVSAAHAVTALAETTAPEPGRNSPACTIVGAVTSGRLLTVGWIGDSRAYWVPEDRAAPSARLTEDDSWAAQMVAAGLLSEAEAMTDHRAHAITAWLGADAVEIEPHTASFEPDRPGVVIVCTDGLWNYADSAEQMAALVPDDVARQPLAGARHLVRHALDSGGHDNVTVAVIPFPARADSA